MTTTTTAWTRRTVAIDGCATSYLRGGSGDPLLFLHGFENLREPHPFMDRLAARFDVIVPDHPGFGVSETPAWLDGITDLAYFYLDFLAALDLRNVHVVGHSLGGWVAAEMAVRNTSRLRSLVLVDAAGVRVIGVDGIDTFLCSPDELRRNLYVDPKLADAMRPPDDDDSLDIQLRNALMTARLGWDPRFFSRDLAKWLHRDDVPTLVLWGAEDRIFPPPFAHEFARLIPGARVETIAGAGHVPHLEKPDAFAERLTAFAASVTTLSEQR
jgi:pimeloyl-ACP methyl ester carboxylesterase